MRLITAAWIAPICAPIIREGGVAILDGRIVAVGPKASLQAQFPSSDQIHFDDAIVLPGMVNAHAHLDLTRTSRPDSPGSFVDWVKGVIAQSMAQPDSGYWVESVLAGRAECLRFGVTSVGDICGRFAPWIRQAISSLRNLRVTSFGEVTAMAQRRGFLFERLNTASDRSHSSETLHIGISPHAPYSIEPQGFHQCLQVARELDLPLTTHLAETPDEAAFLAFHDGPFRGLWDSLGAWDDRVPTFIGGPIRYAQSLGLLDDPRVSLAHVNYCDDDELAILANGKASVIYCPRTHRYFRHPPHRWRKMLERGINVALGTDSCASSPDLNLLDDLRLVHTIAPDVPVEQLWQLITTRAAQAIGAKDVGSLAVGHWADLVAFDVETNDPLRELLETPRLPTETWVTGERQ